MVGVSWDSEMVSRTEEIRIGTQVSPSCQCARRTQHKKYIVVPQQHHISVLHEHHALAPHQHHVSPHTPLEHLVSPTAHTTPAVSHSAATPIRGMLPITGINLTGLMGSAFGLLAAGISALFGAARLGGRRRPHGPA
jgi:hypothetical protein